MQKIKVIAKKLWKDESGQGTAEYVLILVGILLVAGIFRTQLKSMMEDKLKNVKEAILKF